MTTTNSVGNNGNVNTALLGSLGLGAATSSSSSTGTSSGGTQSLGEQDFLTLMTAQLKNQDPMQPMDNSQMLSQLAQFSTVSGITALQTSFSTLSSALTSNQTLQASSLIGHSVMVPGSTMAFDGSNAVKGGASVSSSGDLQINITDASGQVIRNIDLGVQSAGLSNFQWDGKDNSGNTVAAGNYSFTANVVNGTQAQAATGLVSGNVNSISVGSTGALTLNLQGIGPVAISQVQQVN